MKKNKQFECVECGYQSPKFYGKCPQCHIWNSMVEIKTVKDKDGGVVTKTNKPIALNQIDDREIQRTLSGFTEFDRVLGGGVVPGSIILIGGEPGVGKSTLVLQLAEKLSKKEMKILYCSGEESGQQIKMRARRLDLDAEKIFLLTMGSLEDLKEAVKETGPQILIIDSIQTMNSLQAQTIPGSVSSMRFVTSEIIELSKTNDIAVLVIGHITKDGQIAGPKTLEHMVDVVLYFQGELKSDLRILRVEKNRFGSVEEIGIFRMTREGLQSINDPSMLFLHNRNHAESGISILPVMKGLRALLMEIQALVTDSPFVGNPRRIAVGFDHYRMSMLISIIEKKLKLPFYKSDVFLNITGGMNLKETAGDLAIVSALISSFKNINIPQDLVIIGEVGLTGEIRPVAFLENRMKEALRQGFKKFILPSAQADVKNFSKISIRPAANLYEFYNVIKQSSLSPK